MKKILSSIMMLMLAVLSINAVEVPITSGQLAFPGADGYGKYTTGGRGGEVCYVTSLEDGTDNQVGTLRWAIRHDNGGKPRTILFKVGGTIFLKSKLTFNYPDVSILGQTAPGGGICIAGYTFYINKNNVIVRYIRFRAGDLAGYMENKSMASLDVENVKNVIIDHCSLTWSMEECLTAYDSDYTTMQWCIIGEGLYNSMNAKGARSYAMQWGGEHSTMHHCLITNCNNRVPRFNGVRNESEIGKGEHKHDAQVESEFANNVIFNWGKPNSGYGGEDNKTINNDDEGKHLGYNRVYMINNYYRPGPCTKTNVSSSRYFTQIDPAGGNDGYGEWYLNGNKFERSTYMEQVTDAVWKQENLNLINNDNLYGFSTYSNLRAINPKSGYSSTTAQSFYDSFILKSLPEGGLSGLVHESADEAFESVYKGAGASLPKYDAVDTRLLKEAHGDIDPKYFGPISATNTNPARGIGIIDTPNDIDKDAEYGENYVTLTAQAKAGGEATNIYPKLDGTSTAVDTDGDGMPDTYEDNNGFDKNNAEDGAAIADNGYSNLENFLNAVVAGEVTPEGQPTAVVNVKAANSTAVAGKKIYSIDGTERTNVANGVNIIVETMSDGSTITRKVVM